MLERFFFASDNPGRETGSLLSWVQERGADEFSIDRMRVDPRIGPSPFVHALDTELTPFRLPDAYRENVEWHPGASRRGRGPRWKLTLESVAILTRHLPDGLVAPPTYSAEGWIENPRCYRKEALMLGAITHEQGGFIRIDPSELEALLQLPVTFREQWEWTG